MAALETVTIAWWSWLAVVAVQLTPVLLAALIVERVLPPTTWVGLRRALIVAALTRSLMPPTLRTTWPKSGFLAFEAASNWVTDAAVDPQRLTIFAVGVTVLWFVGALLLGLRTVVVTKRARRRWHLGTIETPPWLTEVSRRVAQRIGCSRIPRIVVSSTVSSPCISGTWRPTVFLPSDLLDELPRERIAHVMMHELAHVVRRDLWAAATVAAIRIVYWFHPLVWRAEYRLCQLRELGADRSVAHALEDETPEYRRTLMFFAARAIDDRRSVALWFVRPTTLILVRLNLLERPRRARPWIERSAALVILGALVFGAVPAANDVVVAAEGVAEFVERPPGCLPLRFMVMKRLADAERGEDE